MQGVGFRNFATRIGHSLGLAGYAKNLPDGTVEIVAEGEKETLARFVKRISVQMPLGIHVEKLEEKEKRKIGKKSYAAFTIAF